MDRSVRPPPPKPTRWPLLGLPLLGLLLAGAAVAAADGGRPAAQEAPAQEPAAPVFRPTRAQADRPRVRTARALRSADIRRLFAAAGIAYPPADVLLRGFKNEDLLELWVRPRGRKRYVHLKDYAICARSGGLGPKRRRGDLQVPEGYYRITAYNPASSYHLAMLISYPNRSDRLRKSGPDAGGNICIHGNCVTIGCIPLTDRWIEELYLICLDSDRRNRRRVRVHLFPGRLAGPPWQRLQQRHAEKPGLIRFWRELKPGHDRFARDRIPPRIRIGRAGRYRYPEAARREGGG
jgi:murein L,D-transpeptidase YafK